MHFSTSSTSLLLLAYTITPSHADLLGPRYLPPRDLNSPTSLVTQAWQNLTTTFTSHINGTSPNNLLTGVENVTFSFGAFSIHDSNAVKVLQYHYTSPEIAQGFVGTRNVDADSVYRVASVTKLFTVYAGMLSLTEEQWNRPLTTVLPGLMDLMAVRDGGDVLAAQWDRITVRALSAHLGGVAANVMPFLPNDLGLDYFVALLANSSAATDPVGYGLPPYTGSEPLFSTVCESLEADVCTGEKYMLNARSRPPTFLPWSSPTYSNHGLILLGLAIANLTGKPIDNVYSEAVFQPLGLKSTYSIPPVDQVNRSVIAGGNASLFFVDQGLSKTSGGIFSTLNDLNRFSTGILNSTLLSTEKTRRWMKPVTHTANVNFDVGAPWEILRYTHPAETASAGVVTDLYTKLGDSGFNGAVTVLIPDYGAGFNMLIASALPTRSTLQFLILDAVVRYLLPALEAQAANEASLTLAGTYISTNSTLNSSMTLTVRPSIPGLTVSQWTSNGTDVLAYQEYIFLTTGGVRLLPTIAEAGSTQYAFRVVRVMNQTVVDQAMNVGPFTGSQEGNPDWIYTDQITYLGNPLDLVVFDIDGSNGIAKSIEAIAFGARMERKT